MLLLQAHTAAFTTPCFTIVKLHIVIITWFKRADRRRGCWFQSCRWFWVLVVIAGLHEEQTKFSLQSETICMGFLFIRCPTVSRRAGSVTRAALQFSSPFALRHNGLFNPTGMHLFFVCLHNMHCVRALQHSFLTWAVSTLKFQKLDLLNLKLYLFKNKELQWLNCMSSL